MRIVRQPDGVVLYDPKGKLSGRGAYVCARPECVALAQKRKPLERSLKVSGIPAAFYDELALHAAQRREAALPTHRETNPPILKDSPAIGSAAMPSATMNENEGENI